jgi:hypothetical protein
MSDWTVLALAARLPPQALNEVNFDRRRRRNGCMVCKSRCYRKLGRRLGDGVWGPPSGDVVQLRIPIYARPFRLGRQAPHRSISAVSSLGEPKSCNRKSRSAKNRWSMSALERFADSNQKWRQFRDVPEADIRQLHGCNLRTTLIGNPALASGLGRAESVVRPLLHF